MKSQFLASMSHEFRTPLYDVLGMLDLLRDSDNDPALQHEYLNIAYHSAEQLARVVDDVVDFLQIEAGVLQLEQTDFDVGQIVEDVSSLLVEQTPDKPLELACFVTKDMPQSVSGDPARLHQVLINLAECVSTFSESGELTIGVEVARQEQDQIWLCFQIRATNAHIPAPVQELLLKSSGKKHSAARKYAGARIGWLLSRQLVELMGGEIQLNGHFDQQATLKLVVGFGHPIVKPIRSDITGIRVLVASANETTRAILTDYLKRWGVHYDCVAQGKAAADKLWQAVSSNRAYQVAVLDWDLPDMQGIELARTIHSEPSLSAIQLIMLSSLAQMNRDPEAADEELLLNKPIQQSQLYDALTMLTGGQVSRTVGTADTDTDNLPIQLKGRVLLVEDNLANQTVGREMLKRLGLETELAVNGLEALKSSANTHYDLILMDCRMPEMDGFQATRAIRQQERARKAEQTPIIALTANFLEGDRDACLAAGMDDYLSKPITSQTLAKMLSRWLPCQSVEYVDSSGMGTPGLVEAVQILDEDKLDETRKQLSTNFASLVEAFETTGDTLVEEMCRLAMAGNQSGLVSIVNHFMGNSDDLGANEVTQLCRNLEETANSGDMGSALKLIEDIAGAHTRACEQLRKSIQEG